MHVRRGRHGLELRIDGTLATVLDDGRGTGGIVWSTLAAPLVLLPPGRRRRILILGLGGGGVARAARRLAPTAEIVGVELDADVIAAARDHLRLDELGVSVLHADAEDVLRRDRRRWDAIVEDIFLGDPETVHKPPWLYQRGYAAAWHRLAADGVFVSNTIHESSHVGRTLSELAGRVVGIDVAGYWNTVVVAARDLPDARGLRRALRDAALPGLALNRLRFRRLRG